jgi:hypothetical protein
MNLDQLKKNVGFRVQLERLGSSRELSTNRGNVSVPFSCVYLQTLAATGRLPSSQQNGDGV